MKPREYFALALRIIGVLGIIFLARRFVWDLRPGTFIFIVRLVCAAAGVYFIRGAPLLVKFAYPESTPEPPDKTNP
jgi:hypothetical protein